MRCTKNFGSFPLPFSTIRCDAQPLKSLVFLLLQDLSFQLQEKRQMLGVYALISSFWTHVSKSLYFFWYAVNIVWLFFEQYGWRVVIGFVAGWQFIQRIWLEYERRQKIKSRIRAADPSRVAALNDRRDAVVGKLSVSHTASVDGKRQKDNELRLRQLQSLEKKMAGTGRRLGTTEGDT